MAVVIDGTTGISTPAEAVAGNLSYTGTLTGGAGVINLGSGQVYKDASGNVGIGTSSPATRLHVSQASGTAPELRITSATVYAKVIADDAVEGMMRLDGSYKIGFNVDGTERARIDSSGNLLVGTTTNIGAVSGRLNVKQSAVANCANFQNGTDAGYGIAFYNVAGTVAGSIGWTATVTSYVTSSDYRLKNTIAPMTGALDKVALLKPVTYKWNVDGSDGQGFIAHELDEVVPGCVTGEKDAVDAEGKPQYQGIDTSFLVATLTAAIQELKAIVDTQAISITALNERLTALEAPIV